MDKNSVGISVLNGEIRSSASRTGESAQTWQSPGNADDLVSLGATLKGALQGIRPDCKRIAIVLAHPKLTDQIIEVPPVKGWKLEQVVYRKVESSKTFAGDAIWSFQFALPTKTAKSVLLHLCPKPVIDQLTKGCEEAQLHLVRVLPTTAVLISHLRSLPLKKDELAVLAAETGNCTTVVIGRKDGLVCLGRVVRSSWNTEPDRVNMDLTRSIGFAEQQTGLTVSGVWLFGAGAESQVPVMQSLLKLPVAVSPVPYSPSYWAQQGEILFKDGDGNLLSRDAQQAPQRKRLLTVTGALLVFMLLLTLLATLVIEVLRHRTENAIVLVGGKIADLRTQKVEYERSIREVSEMEQVTQAARDVSLRATPAWFLGYLGEVLPEELVLTDVHVTRTNDSWVIRLAGAGSPGTNQPGAMDQAFAVFTNALALGPFHLSIVPPPPKKEDDSLADDGLALAVAGRPTGDVTHFLIEGSMK